MSKTKKMTLTEEQLFAFAEVCMAFGKEMGKSVERKNHYEALTQSMQQVLDKLTDEQRKLLEALGELKVH